MNKELDLDEILTKVRKYEVTEATAIELLNKFYANHLKAKMPKEISVQEIEDRQLHGYNYAIQEVHQILEDL
jgi:hypothetical protein